MTDRILYLEGSSGISGDMTVSALLDLGADREYLKREIGKLPLEGYRLVIGRTEKCGIDACAFFVEMYASRPQPARNYRQIRQMLEESQLEPKVKERALAIFGVLAEAEAGVHGTTPEQVHFHEVGAVDSCAEGIAVVNIDNGFGAGYMATQINRLAVNGNTESTISGGKSEKDEKNGGTR